MKHVLFWSGLIAAVCAGALATNGVQGALSGAFAYVSLDALWYSR